MIDLNSLTVKNESASVICTYDGWPVKQHYQKPHGRYSVYFPKGSPFRTWYGRERMQRSHFVVMVRDGITEIPHGYVVHHVDHDRANDHPDNLKLMTAAEHDRWHREIDQTCKKHGASFKGRKHSPETIEKMRNLAQKRGNNSVWDLPKSGHTEETKQKMSDKASGEKNSQHRSDLDEKAVRDFYAKCGNVTMTASHFGCSNTAVRNRIAGVVPDRKVKKARGKSLNELVKYSSMYGLKDAAIAFSLTEDDALTKIKHWWGHHEDQNSNAA